MRQRAQACLHSCALCDCPRNPGDHECKLNERRIVAGTAAEVHLRACGLAGILRNEQPRNHTCRASHTTVNTGQTWRNTSKSWTLCFM